MKIAFIPPTDLLAYTMLTNYQLVLPHLLQGKDTKDEKGKPGIFRSQYLEWYSEMARQGNNYMILDNGEAEGENRFTAEELIGTARHLGFNEVVAHDKMADMLGTVESTSRFLDISRVRNADKKLKVGIVAQGKSFQEVEAFVAYFMDLLDDWEVLYIPRHLIATLGSTRARIEVTQRLDKRFNLQSKGIEVHFLGAHHDAPVELIHAAQTVPWIRGMDTSMPFNYAFAGATLGEGHHKRPENYFDITADRFPQQELIRRNADLMLKWANVPNAIAVAGPTKE